MSGDYSAFSKYNLPSGHNKGVFLCVETRIRASMEGDQPKAREVSKMGIEANFVGSAIAS